MGGMKAPPDASNRMRVLLVGGSGTLGHVLRLRLARDFEVLATYRDRPLGVAGPVAVGVDLTELQGRVPMLVETFRPAVIVNCAGVVRQRYGSVSPATTYMLNGCVPHYLAAVGRSYSARVVQISSDCVFSGERGWYVETDMPDGRDAYSHDKIAGELLTDEGWTIRTSFIGPGAAYGFFEWARSQAGRAVRGYERARWNGLTTFALADVLAEVILPNLDRLPRLIHVSSADAISKADLLRRLSATFGWGLTVEGADEPVADMTLNSGMLQALTGWVPLTVDGQIARMAAIIGSGGEIRDWMERRTCE